MILWRKRYDNEGTPVPGGYWWPDVFYNIGYRAYAEGVKVKSVTRHALENAKYQFLVAEEKLLMSPDKFVKVTGFEGIVPPGDSMAVVLTEKGYAVNMLAMEIQSDNMNQALRSTVISGSFDGFRTLWVPVGEFFGTGYCQG